MVGDPNFGENGEPADTSVQFFSPVQPKSIRLYVETSGSMNGFFRSNQPTEFKRTVWQVFSGLGGLADQVVTPLGSTNRPCSLAEFRNKMNTGGFVSSVSTNVPDMLRTIVLEMDTAQNQAAVLVSDMKYSPQGQRDMAVLLDQYQTDLRNLFGAAKVSLGFVCAASQFLNAKGEVVAQRAPYFFIILGNAQNVAFLRNAIATWTETDGCYVESGDIGVDYLTPPYELRDPINLFQSADFPTVFTGMDPDYCDTCRLTLRVNLEGYPWYAAVRQRLDSCLIVSSTYGSGVSAELKNMVDDHHYNHDFVRKAYADYEIKVYDMPLGAEVVSWRFSIRPFDLYMTGEFIQMIETDDENDPWGAFSFDRFIQGVGSAQINRGSELPNHILISTSQQ